MRSVVRVIGALLCALGLVVLVGGVVAAVRIGQDDTVDLPTTRISTGGVAVVTHPGLLDRFGPTLVVEARSADAHPLWVGVAHQSDLDSYLTGNTYAELTQVSTLGSLRTDDVEGRTTTLVAPSGRDWWVTSASGTDPSPRWQLLDGRYGVAVLRADGRPGLAADVSVGLQVAGLFRSALLVAGGGLVLLLLGVAAVVLRRPRRSGPTLQMPQPANASTPVSPAE